MWVTVVNWHWWKAGISGTLGLRLCKIFCRLFSLPAPPPPTSVILKATCDEEITIWKPGTSLAVQWFTLPSNTEGVGSIPCQGAKSLCESEKVKVYSVVSDSLQPRGLYSPGILQARILESVAYHFSRELPDPGIEPGSPALQADSLPTELSGKPKSLHAFGPKNQNIKQKQYCNKLKT